MKPSSLCTVFFIIFSISSNLVTSQHDSCSQKLDPKTTPFDPNSLHCVNIWPAYDLILRYAKVSPNAMNFVVSFPADIDAYVGVGFSEDGQMVGSVALVGWINSSNPSLESQFYKLNGKTPDQVTPVANHFSKPVDSNITTAFLSFELLGKPTPYLVMAIGPNNTFPSAPNYVLTKHIDHNSLRIDYQTGEAPTPAPAS